MAIAGRSVKVFVGGTEITHLVHGIEIVAEVGSVVRTRLELWCGVEFKDGALRLDGPAVPGKTLQPVIRAMALEGVVPGAE